MNVSSSSLRRGRQSLLLSNNTVGGGGGSAASFTPLVRSTSSSSTRRRRRLVRSSTSSSSQSSSSNNNNAVRPHAKNNNVINQDDIFKGVTACLSGQSYDNKEYNHSLLTNAGGSTMGNFDPRYVTHLILDEGTGSKYDHWIEHCKLHLQHVEEETSRGRTTTTMTTMKNEEEGPSSLTTSSPYVWTTKLHLVTTAWVEACVREGRRVSEDQYRLSSPFDCHPTNISGLHQGALSLTVMRGEEEEDHRISHINVDDDIVKPTSLLGGKREELVKRYPSLAKRCEYVLHQQQQQQQQLTTIEDDNVNRKRKLFAGQSFLLVGFDDDDDDDDDDTHRHNDDKNIKNILSKLIRKFGGTIYYEPNEWITMVLLSLANIVDDDNDSSNKETVVDDETKEKNKNNIYLQHKLLWNDVHYFCREHPNGPTCVDVDYILTAVYTNGDWEGVNNPSFPAEPVPPQSSRRKQIAVSKQQQQRKKAKSETKEEGSSVPMSIVASERKMKSNSPSKTKSKTKQLKNDTIDTSSLLQKSDIFHGDVFVIIPCDNSGTSELFLGYSNEEMETTIIKHGGKVMNRSCDTSLLLDEFAALRKTTLTYGTHYVISSIHTTDYEQTGVLAGGDVNGGGSIEFIHVSSVWIAACVKHGCKYDPTEYPMLFQPQTWPIHLLPKNTTTTTTPLSEKKKDQKKTTSTTTASDVTKSNPNFLVSVTGFTDSSRYGIISMLNMIGAGYTDHLSRKNTHLICKDVGGQKYTKAVEWGMHVVSAEWLYHIVRYGYKEGLENRFSFTSSSADAATIGLMFDEQQITYNNPSSVNKEEDKVRSSLLDKEEDKVKSSSLDGDDNSVKEEIKDAASELKTNSFVPPEANRNNITLEDGQRDVQFVLPVNSDGDTLVSSNKRLQSALRTLEEPMVKRSVTVTSNNILSPNSNGNISPPRRHRRKQSDIEDEGMLSPTEVETQFTIGGPLLANDNIADISKRASKRKHKNDGTNDTYSYKEVPPSQADDAEDNGESQVVWFAAARR